MTASHNTHDLREHFAHCVQVFGGATAASRRLGIDERAIRRFINGDLPLGASLLKDTATALCSLMAEAAAAEGQIAVVLGATRES